jgi:hypothetical protein
MWDHGMARAATKETCCRDRSLPPDALVCFSFFLDPCAVFGFLNCHTTHCMRVSPLPHRVVYSMDPSSLCQCAPNRVACPGCTALHCTCRHSWNTFCAEDMVNESNMKEMADALMSSGMVAAGYSTVNVVCNGLCRSRSHAFLRLEQPGPRRCVSIGSGCVRLHARVRVQQCVHVFVCVCARVGFE